MVVLILWIKTIDLTKDKIFIDMSAIQNCDISSIVWFVSVFQMISSLVKIFSNFFSLRSTSFVLLSKFIESLQWIKLEKREIFVRHHCRL